MKTLSAVMSVLLLVSCSSYDPRDWSRREKGTALGAAGGAAVGGIVGAESGNTGTGAVVGGALGAGAGNLIGREQERRADEDDDERRYRGRYDWDDDRDYYRDRYYRDDDRR